jgi:hypothetical protein
MKADSATVWGAADGQRQLGAVSPSRWTWRDRRRCGLTLSDACKSIADDSGLRAELRFVGEVLYLAATAAVDRIVRTRWIDAIGRWLFDTDDAPATERLLARDSGIEHVAGRRARNENHHSFGSPNAIPSRCNGIDPYPRH